MSKVNLEPWEREWAGHVGKMRDEVNANKRDAAYYDPARMEDNLTASVAACCAELAVAKLLNKYWDGSYWTAHEHRKYAGRPDVGQNTEVRRTRSRGGALVVRRRDVDRGRLMVLAYPIPDDFVTVDVLGWAWASEVWDAGRPADYDKEGTTRLVGQEWLNPL